MGKTLDCRVCFVGVKGMRQREILSAGFITVLTVLL